MKLKVDIILGVWCLAICSAKAIGFTGQIIGVPEVEDLELQSKVLNGLNYQSRFNIDLIALNNSTDGLNSKKAVLNEDYKFKYDDLKEGDYELIVNSYDYTLNNNRFRIIVNEKEGVIKGKEDALISNNFNESSTQVITHINPLFISVGEAKQYYERQLGSISDILMNSPFGFIFKNRTYTIMFTIAVAIMVTPYILQFVNPDFADTFNELKEESAAVRAQNKPPQIQNQPLSNNKGGATQQLKQRNAREKR